MSDATEGRLLRQEIELALGRALANYAWGLDTVDEPTLRAALHPDVTFHGLGQDKHGADQVVEFLFKTAANRQWAKHFLTNPSVLDTSQTPAFRAYFIFMRGVPTGPEIGFGTYRGKLARDGAGDFVIHELEVTGEGYSPLPAGMKI